MAIIRGRWIGIWILHHLHFILLDFLTGLSYLYLFLNEITELLFIVRSQVQAYFNFVARCSVSSHLSSSNNSFDNGILRSQASKGRIMDS